MCYECSHGGEDGRCVAGDGLTDAGGGDAKVD
jgi:hypothetical protein